MTQEELEKAAENFEALFNRQGNAWAFQSGAEWARQQLVHKPNCAELTPEEFSHQIYGAMIMQKKIIEKSCDWMKDNLWSFTYVKNGERYIDIELLIKQYRIYIEEL